MPHRLHCTVLLALACTLEPSVSPLAAAQSSHAVAHGPSDTAFVLARAGIIPENIVYDASLDRFLGGDLERDGMIEMRRDGSIRLFAEAAGIDGRVLGLKLDAGASCSGECPSLVFPREPAIRLRRGLAASALRSSSPVDGRCAGLPLRRMGPRTCSTIS
jgi:hypothetical protein